jgi:c-di-GMP-binding flagellar brake protein YcgR
LATLHEADVLFIDDIIHRATPVGFWFQDHDSMILFQSTILKKRRRALGQNQLLVSWPERINVVEERHQPRRLVPESAKITARIQVLSPSREIEHETSARIWDIGLEGASLICQGEPALVALPKDSWMNIIIGVRDDGKTFVLPASFRHMRRLPEDKLRLGLQFLPSGDPAAASARSALGALLEELGGSAAKVPPATAA